MTEPLDHDPFVGLPELAVEVRGLNAELARQDHRGKWNRRLIYLLATFSAALLVLGLFVWRNTATQLCSTNRSQALTGPASERVTLIIDAFRSSLLGGNVDLNNRDRAATLAELERDRDRYPGIPAARKLAAFTDAQLLIVLDAIRATDQDDLYQQALTDHPVCSFWGI